MENAALNLIADALVGLESVEAKRRESTILRLNTQGIFDVRLLIPVLKLAAKDPIPYVRVAAGNLLQSWARRPEIDDALHAHELEFLLKETSTWNGVETQREPYAQAYARLQAHRVQTDVVLPATPIKNVAPATPESTRTPGQSDRAAPSAATVPAPGKHSPAKREESSPQRTGSTMAAPRKPPTPPAPAVPFDQWLLSERNIKIALFSGGALILLAALIFIGVNWNYLPGIAKLAITAGLTLGLFTGGAFLFQRPALKIGGVALLAIASGFVPLNFAVLQLYLLPASITGEQVWLTASLVSTAAYAVTALRTRHVLFTWFAIVASASAIMALAFVLSLQPEQSLVLYGTATIVGLAAAFRLKRTPLAPVTYVPLLISTQVAAPIIFLASGTLWGLAQLDPETFGSVALRRDVWSALAAMLLVGAFYVECDVLWKWLAARWAAAIGFALTAVLIVAQLHFDAIQSGVVLKLSALAFLLIGWWLQQRVGKRQAGLPLYVAGYALALLVTLQGAASFNSGRSNLALALVADVALLGLSWRIHRAYAWVYGAAWLLIVPVFLYATIYIPAPAQWAIPLAILMTSYVGIGYRLGGNELKSSGPFLSAAAFLSLVVPALASADLRLTSGLLVLVTALYGAVAIWLKRKWLLAPALLAIHLAGLTVLMTLWSGADLARAAALAALAAGDLFLTVGLFMRERSISAWRIPFYLFVVADLLLALGTAVLLAYGREPLLFDQLVLISVLVVETLAALSTAWFEGKDLAVLFPLPILSYVGAVLLVWGAYELTRLAVPSAEFHPAFVAGVGAVLVGVAWRLRHSPWNELYGTPLRHVGLGVIVFASAASLRFHSLPIAVTFGMAGAALLADCIVRRNIYLLYAGIGAMHIAGFATLMTLWSGADLEHAFVSAALLTGVLLFAGGVFLRERPISVWRIPLYFCAFADLVLALGFAFVLEYAQDAALLDRLLLIVTIFVEAFVALSAAWLEQQPLTRLGKVPVLSYLGAALLVLGAYELARLLIPAAEYHPAFVAGACALLVAVAWLLRAGTWKVLYGTPLRFVGLGATPIVLFASLYPLDMLPIAITFGIVGVALLSDGVVRRNIYLQYLSSGAGLVVLWALLHQNKVIEIQAYALPLGGLLLVLGWNERRRGHWRAYELATALGLLVLMGSAFYQSFIQFNAALLLLLESVLALAWGLRLQAKVYVGCAVAALIVNALAQYGPAFVNLDRWIQIGAIGTSLLMGGLTALFRRERVLQARQSLAQRWHDLQP